MIVAIIAGVATVIAAVIGLVAVLADDSDDKVETNASPGVPEILIRETAFTSLPGGEVEIRVSGGVANFGPKDRLYAIAKPVSPPPASSWWVSQEVAPNLDGGWAAEIQARAQPGQRLTVTALRIPGEVYAATSPGVPFPGPLSWPAVPGSPSPATSTSPAASGARPPLTAEQIRDALRVEGPDAPWVIGRSAPSNVAIPPG